MKKGKRKEADSPEIIRRDIVNSAIQIRKKRTQARQIWGNIFFRLACFIIMIAAIFTFLLGVETVQTNDMFPNVRAGDMVIYLRIPQYKNSDIVVYDNTIGRIQGMPGMEIGKTGSGQITIEGNLQPAQERLGLYYETKIRKNGAITYPSTVPEGQYFVLGDQREKARDSRIKGFIQKKDLKGKVFIVIKRRAL